MKPSNIVLSIFLFAILSGSLMLIDLTPMTSSNIGNAGESHKGSPNNLLGKLEEPKIQPSILPELDGESVSAIPLQTGSWTVLIYLDGDNDLWEYAFNDLNMMERVGSTSNVNIIVFVDFFTDPEAPFSGAKCYNITYDTDDTTIHSAELTTPLPTEPNMGDATTLLDFISFGQGYALADNYLLVLWDHGGGFHGVCFDETNSNDRLVPSEIATVLNNTSIQPINVVAFDACLMGQLEIAYEICNYTDYIVFSEDSIPVTGFPYEDILSDLTSSPTTIPAMLVSNIVFRYKQAYSAGGRFYNPDVNYITISAINCSSIEAVAQALDSFIQLLLPSYTLSSLYESLCRIRGNTQSFGWPDFMDLASFAYQAQQTLTDPVISNAASTLYTATIAAVSAEQHLSGVPNAKGLALAFSAYGSIQLELAADTQYDEFMTDFLSIGSGYTTTPLLIDGPGEYYGYLDGEDDEVYFAFIPESNTRFNIHLESMQLYDEDFDLYLYDSDHIELDRSISASSTEFIQNNFVAGETYYVLVRSYSNSEIDFGLGAFHLTIAQTTPFNPTTFAIFGGLIIVVVIVGAFLLMFFNRTRRLRRTWEESGYPSYTTSRADQPESLKFESQRTEYCSHCGAILPRYARYCPSCGSEERPNV